MALPTSGPISFSQIQAEFGGANPISLSEYYRGGSYVPSTIPATIPTFIREPASGEAYSRGTTSWVVSYAFGSITINWNGTIIGDIPSGSTSFSSGEYTYYRGALRETLSSTFDKPYYYAIYRTKPSPPKTVNTDIPSSGAISLSQMRGGTKT